MTTELKQLERKLAVTSQIARVTSTSLGLDELMPLVYEAIAPFFIHEGYRVLRYSRSEESLQVLFGVMNEEKMVIVESVSLESFSGRVIQEDRPIYIPDSKAHVASAAEVNVENPDVEQGSWLGVPLRIRDQVVGLLSISTPEADAYDEEDEHLLLIIADQLAVAIENARLFEVTRAQAERLSLLNRVSKAVSTTLDLNQLFESLYKEIAATFDHDELLVVLHDEPANELDIVFGIMNGARLGQQRLPFGGLSGLVISKCKTVNIQHFSIERENLPVPQFLFEESSMPESWLGVPLVVGDRILGALLIMKDVANAYAPEKVRLFETIADQIAFAVSNAELFESMNSSAERLSIVNRIGRAVAREQTLEELAETVYREIAPVFEAATFYIALLNEDETMLVFPFVMDDGKRIDVGSVAYGQGLTSSVIRTKKTLHTHTPEEYARASGIALSSGSSKEPVSWLGIPLFVEGHVIGIINIQSYHSFAYSDDQELLLRTIADQIAMSFKHALLDQTALRELEERKLAEARLVEERTLLRTIINNIPDFIYAKDLESRFVVANEAIARFFGQETGEDLVGKSIGDLLPEDVSPEYLEEERQIVAHGKNILNQEERMIDQSLGKLRWLLVTKMRLHDSHGNPVGIVGIDRDITARKIAEEEVKRYVAEVEVANDEVRTFAYIVSHDLRAPLVNLKGFSSELKDSMKILSPHLQNLIEGLDESEREEVIVVLEEDIPEALGFIETSVSRMDGFINSVLKLSRIGRRELTRQPVDAAAFVETCRQSLGHQMEERQRRTHCR